MAEFRSIHSKMWRDEWFTELPTDGKLLFVYLITNPSASVCGMYQLPDKFISFDTGLSIARLVELKKQFKAAGKIDFEGNVIWVKKMRHYQATKSETVAKRIQKDFDEIPECEIKGIYAKLYGIHTVSIPYSQLASDTDTDTDKDTDKDKDTAEKDSDFSKVWTTYENIFGSANPVMADELHDAIVEFTADWVVDALGEMTKNGKRSWKYARKILENWKTYGYRVDTRKNGNGGRPTDPPLSENGHGIVVNPDGSLYV